MLSKAQVKYIQSLYQKKFRDEEASFLVEGPKIVQECCLAVPAQIRTVYALEAWVQQQAHLLKNIDEGKIRVIEAGDLEKISSLTTPNQVLAVMEKIQAPKPDFNNTLTVLLHDLQDPGNLGTLIRIADWFGIQNIVCSRESADLYNPKVIQSSMGSFLRVNVFYEELGKLLESHPQIRLYATSLNGKSIYGYHAVKEGFVLIGNESRGLSEEWFQKAQEKITIPRLGKAESLNAAVAAGIILYQLTKPV